MYNDYHSPRGFNILPIGIKNLIIINGLIFLATLTPIIGEYLLAYFPLAYFELPNFLPTQLITYQFMHSPNDFWHILFNMFILWMFGSIVENIWGTKKFILYYLVAGIGAGLFHLAYTWFALHYMPGTPVGGYLLGASGAVYGIMLAYAFMFPNNIVNIYFVIPVKVKYFVVGLLAIDFISGISNSPTSNVAHFAHIGGALTGLVILLVWQRKGKLWGAKM